MPSGSSRLESKSWNWGMLLKPLIPLVLCSKCPRPRASFQVVKSLLFLRCITGMGGSVWSWARRPVGLVDNVLGLVPQENLKLFMVTHWHGKKKRPQTATCAWFRRFRRLLAQFYMKQRSFKKMVPTTPDSWECAWFSPLHPHLPDHKISIRAWHLGTSHLMWELKAASTNSSKEHHCLRCILLDSVTTRKTFPANMAFLSLVSCLESHTGQGSQESSSPFISPCKMLPK